jgi:hypothetical protein
MKWRIIVFMTGVLAFMLSSPVASQDWVDIKDPKELSALHSNKTFRCQLRETPFDEHYRADGKGIIIYSAEKRLACTWEVRGNDQVCVSDERGTKCWQFQRSKRNPDEYVKRCPLDAYTVIFKVEDGIPGF